MKYLTQVLIVVICLFATDYFIRKYLIKPQIIERPAPITESLIDSIKATLYPIKIDTIINNIPYYITKEKTVIDTVVSRDTIYIIDSGLFETEFKFKKEAFDVKFLTYASCPVDSVNLSFNYNKAYWNSITEIWYDTGYKNGFVKGKKDFPLMRKLVYIGAGMLIYAGSEKIYSDTKRIFK